MLIRPRESRRLLAEIIMRCGPRGRLPRWSCAERPRAAGYSTLMDKGEIG